MEKKDKPLSECNGEVCGDNRFELIEKYKAKLIENTNIEKRPEEMEVIDTVMFRFWQMGWLDKLERFEPPVAEDTNVSSKPAKPRLAEILGVEVGERFHLPVNGGTLTFWVTEKGYFKTDPPQLVGSTYLLLDAINHPESIIRAPRLTQAELAICKAVGAKWVSRESLGGKNVILWDAEPEYFDNGEMCATDMTHVLARMYKGFESVHPGDCICVEEAGGDV